MFLLPLSSGPPPAHRAPSPVLAWWLPRAIVFSLPFVLLWENKTHQEIRTWFPNSKGAGQPSANASTHTQFPASSLPSVSGPVQGSVAPYRPVGLWLVLRASASSSPNSWPLPGTGRTGQLEHEKQHLPFKDLVPPGWQSKVCRSALLQGTSEGFPQALL